MKQTRQRKKGKLYNRKAMALLFIGFLMLFCLVNVLVRDRNSPRRRTACWSRSQNYPGQESRAGDI